MRHARQRQSQVCGVHGRGLSGLGQQLQLRPLSIPEPGAMAISPGRRVFRRLTRPHRPWPGCRTPTNPPSRRARPNWSRIAVPPYSSPEGPAGHGLVQPVTEGNGRRVLHRGGLDLLCELRSKGRPARPTKQSSMIRLGPISCAGGTQRPVRIPGSNLSKRRAGLSRGSLGRARLVAGLLLVKVDLGDPGEALEQGERRRSPELGDEAGGRGADRLCGCLLTPSQPHDREPAVRLWRPGLTR
jgi:hypothetical protein